LRPRLNGELDDDSVKVYHTSDDSRDSSSSMGGSRFISVTNPRDPSQVFKFPFVPLNLLSMWRVLTWMPDSPVVTMNCPPKRRSIKTTCSQWLTWCTVALWVPLFIIWIGEVLVYPVVSCSWRSAILSLSLDCTPPRPQLDCPLLLRHPRNVLFWAMFVFIHVTNWSTLQTVTIFAYGVTSSGKTHTMQGTKSDPGVIPRVVRASFSFSLHSPPECSFQAMFAKKSHIERYQTSLSMSYMEIYKDDVYDLLVTRENVCPYGSYSVEQTNKIVGPETAC
jgi:Kinesin-like protein